MMTMLCRRRPTPFSTRALTSMHAVACVCWCFRFRRCASRHVTARSAAALCCHGARMAQLQRRVGEQLRSVLPWRVTAAAG